VCETRRSPSDPIRGAVGEARAPGPENTGDSYGIDDYFVDRAIDLAWQAAGKTHPNPLVGALVVKEGRLLGVGHHQQYGEEHAETIALRSAGRESRGSTLYVTLEPCAHEGNTSPCVDRIFESGVSRVVIPTLDPDDRVNGRGVRVLRENGIRVDVGNRSERALLLNMPYFKRVLGLGPAVTLKMAVTLDGRIASRPGARDDITGREARRMVHRLRAVHNAVLVGINTLVVDSPRLDCRLVDSVASPVPVVLDTHLRFPAGHEWLGARDVVIAAGNDAPAEKGKKLSDSGARVIRCDTTGSGVDVAQVIDALFESGMTSVLVEGGGRVFSSFAEAGLWDGMFVFVSPELFGPHGVNMSDRPVDRARMGAVLAGTSMISGEGVMSFVNEKTRRALLSRLLPRSG